MGVLLLFIVFAVSGCGMTYHAITSLVSGAASEALLATMFGLVIGVMMVVISVAMLYWRFLVMARRQAARTRATAERSHQDH